MALKIERVLVGVSGTSRKVLNAAAEICRKSGAQMEIFSVVRPPSSMYGMSAVERRKRTRLAASTRLAGLEALAKPLHADGVSVRCAVGIDRYIRRDAQPHQAIPAEPGRHRGPQAQPALAPAALANRLQPHPPLSGSLVDSEELHPCPPLRRHGRRRNRRSPTASRPRSMKKSSRWHAPCPSCSADRCMLRIPIPRRSAMWETQRSHPSLFQSRSRSRKNT